MLLILDLQAVCSFVIILTEEGNGNTGKFSAVNCVQRTRIYI